MCGSRCSRCTCTNHCRYYYRGGRCGCHRHQNRLDSIKYILSCGSCCVLQGTLAIVAVVDFLAVILLSVEAVILVQAVFAVVAVVAVVAVRAVVIVTAIKAYQRRSNSIQQIIKQTSSYGGCRRRRSCSSCCSCLSYCSCRKCRKCRRCRKFHRCRRCVVAVIIMAIKAVWILLSRLH